MSTAAKKAPAKRASKDKTAPQAAPATSLVLRVCRPDMTAYGRFVWPSELGATVEAPDWRNDNDCGHGLHGWLCGHGNHGCVNHWAKEGAKWLVLEIETDSIVMLGGKCKFPRATVRFVGEKHDAATYLITHEPRAAGVAVIGARIAVGDGGTATAGALSTLTGGYGATLTGGDRATLTGGYGATLTGGDYAELRIRYLDAKCDRWRTAIAYVGENGIKAGVAYRLNGKHEFVEADQ